MGPAAPPPPPSCPHDPASSRPLRQHHPGLGWPRREAGWVGGESHAMPSGQPLSWGIGEQGTRGEGDKAGEAQRSPDSSSAAKEKQAALEEWTAAVVITSGGGPGASIHVPCGPVSLPSTASGLEPERGPHRGSPTSAGACCPGSQVPAANPAGVRMASLILSTQDAAWPRRPVDLGGMTQRMNGMQQSQAERRGDVSKPSQRTSCPACLRPARRACCLCALCLFWRGPARPVLRGKG